MIKKNSMLDDLSILDKEARPIVGKGCSIKIRGRKSDGWVSGLPYIFSASSERAFVFADKSQAKQFIALHRDELPHPTITEWGQS